MNGSEEVTKTWVKRKGLLVMNRPRPSRFSFAVCLTIVLALTLGFICGFITAGFTLQENFSTVYQSLLMELETARTCFERERLELNKSHEQADLINSN